MSTCPTNMMECLRKGGEGDQRPLSAAACCPLLLLTCALLVTSSHSEGWQSTAAYFARDLALARADAGVGGGPAIREVASGHLQPVRAIHFDAKQQAYSVGGRRQHHHPEQHHLQQHSQQQQQQCTRVWSVHNRHQPTCAQPCSRKLTRAAGWGGRGVLSLLSAHGC